MKPLNSFVRRLSWLSACFTIFIMIGLLIFKEDVFLYRGSISFSEILLALGFLVILIFDFASFTWIIRNRKVINSDRIKTTLLLLSGMFCLLLLPVDKVMIDEIGKEYLQYKEFIGEWVILYLSLSVQFLYNIFVIRIA